MLSFSLSPLYGVWQTKKHTFTASWRFTSGLFVWQFVCGTVGARGLHIRLPLYRPVPGPGFAVYALAGLPPSFKVVKPEKVLGTCNLHIPPSVCMCMMQRTPKGGKRDEGRRRLREEGRFVPTNQNPKRKRIT